MKERRSRGSSESEVRKIQMVCRFNRIKKQPLNMGNEQKLEKSQEKFLEISDRLKRLPVRIPRVGDCFFVEAPTLDPLEEQDCVLVVAIKESRGALTAVPISLEYWEASEHDYFLDPSEWEGGYSAIVETWNPLLVLPKAPVRIHATLSSDVLEKVRLLFHYHQRGESPPPDFEGVGKPLTTDDDPRWEFRAREAALVERARRHLHEGWSAKVLVFPKTRIQAKMKNHEPMRAAAKEASSVRTLTGRILEAFREAMRDEVIFETQGGVLFMRYVPKERLELYWYSEQGQEAPLVEASPPMTPPSEEASSVPFDRILGFWPYKPRLKEIRLNILDGERLVSLKVVLV